MKKRKKVLAKETREKIERINYADVQVYQHFLKKFHRQVETWDENYLNSYMKQINEWKDYFYRECVEYEVKNI